MSSHRTPQTPAAAASAFEVTFRIAQVKKAGVVELTEVLRSATGLPASNPAWSAVAERLARGESVRLRLSDAQFCRFFIARRAAGNDAIQRLKWDDAVEVGLGDGVVDVRAAVAAEAPAAAPQQPPARRRHHHRARPWTFVTAEGEHPRDAREVEIAVASTAADDQEPFVATGFFEDGGWFVVGLNDTADPVEAPFKVYAYREKLVPVEAPKPVTGAQADLLRDGWTLVEVVEGYMKAVSPGGVTMWVDPAGGRAFGPPSIVIRSRREGSSK